MSSPLGLYAGLKFEFFDRFGEYHGTQDDYIKDTFLMCYDNETLNNVSKTYNNYSAKKRRLKTKITKNYRFGYCYFLTLTFSDYCLDSCSEKTRRRYVTRFLSGLNAFYIANIDYGSRTEREHYHAFVVLENELDVYKTVKQGKKLFLHSKLLDNWSFGFYSCLSCLTDDDDISRVSKYIAKFSNHALKGTTRQQLIYCRKVPEWLHNARKERSDLLTNYMKKGVF